MSARAAQFAAEGRLLVFVGAGVSSTSPTCLPSWWGVNRSVILALRDRIADLVGRDRAQALADTITARQESMKFPPEYQAEVIVRRLRGSYFSVLQCLDSTTPNAVHRGIAALAREGRVPAVVTTNFDRAVETAFRELGVPVEVCFAPKHFEALAGRLGERGRPCPILKLHGSADEPDTLVDTLSQRKRGLPPATAACVRRLLREAHWLFLGYSGADLSADENYLFLRPDAAEAQGFTWLLRTQEQALPALAAICDAYQGRSEIVHAELPGWLADFSRPLLERAYAAPPPLAADEEKRIRTEAAARVARHAADWAAAERFERIALAFADLLDAVSEPAAAIDLVRRVYDGWPADDRRSGHLGVVIDVLANLYSQGGELDRAVALFGEALAIFDPAADEKQHVGALNNLALVYSKRGQTDEALDIYCQALTLAEKTGDLYARGVALHNLAMIQHRLGLSDEASRLYREELRIVEALGDEPARAFVLNNLGELEVSARRFDEGAEHLHAAIRIRDRIGDDLGAAHARANLANAHTMRGSHVEALRTYEECLAVFRRFGERVDVARTLSNMARVKENTGRRDEALALLGEALLEADATASDVVRAQVLELRGELEQKQGRHEAAAATFAEALELALRMRDPQRERDARTGRAIALKELGQLEASVALLREGLALTRKHGFPAPEWVLDHLADSLNRGGLARQERGELGQALADFVESAEIWRRQGMAYNEGQTLLNIANTQVLLKRYPEAAESYRATAAALRQAADHTDADGAAVDAELHAGELFVWLDRWDDARAAFSEVVSRAAEYNLRAERMNRIGALASKQLEHGNVGRALWILEECVRLNREGGHVPDVAACLLNIGGIAKATGDTVRARACFEEAAALLERHPMLELARKLLAEVC